MTLYVDEKNELEPKGLFRSINETVKYLDQKRKHAKNCSDLATNSIENQRVKLCMYAEKLMFIAPVEYGKKCEDILWKKGFHDIYTTIKRLKKGNDGSTDGTLYLQHVINNGIGFYHHLLMRLQDVFNINLQRTISFPLFIDDYGLPKKQHGVKPWSSEKLKNTNSDLLEWTHEAVYKCLTCIGDLNRYMLDIFPGWDLATASHYYWQALLWEPSIGIALNQLGSLALFHNNILDATYYYMRSLCCTVPFEDAERNLNGLFENFEMNSSNSVDNTCITELMIVILMQLSDTWFFQKKTLKDALQLAFEFLETTNNYYHTVDNVPSKAVLKPNSLQDLVYKKEVIPMSQIYPDSSFKMLVICMMSHYKLVQKGSEYLNSSITVISSLIFHLVESTLIKIRASLPVPSPPVPKSSQNGLRRLRRRRRGTRCSSLSGDSSEENCDSSEDDSSEEDLVFDNSSDDDCNHLTNGLHNGLLNNHSGKSKENGTSKKSKDTKKQKDNLLIKILNEDYYTLQAIKISCDWIQSNPSVLDQVDCWLAFADNFVLLLNFLYPIYNLRGGNSNEDDCSNASLEKKFIALPEDTHLRGLLSLKPIHDNVIWDYNIVKHQTHLQQIRERIQRLSQFGIFLSQQPNSRVIYQDEIKWFSISGAPPKKQANKIEQDNTIEKGKLLQDMAQLWLEEEVRNLENKMKKTSKTSMLPPYLVVDCDALTHHYLLVKKLVSCKKFIVLIPSAVISALDELKRNSASARDAIRWMESQFRNGNCHVRAQRNEETQAIPAITYPRKKDKEAWLFIKILECCYFLSCRNNNHESDLNHKDGSNFVRLLTGSRMISSAISGVATKNGHFHMAIATKAAGITVDHITDFHSKWKNVIKNYG